MSGVNPVVGLLDAMRALGIEPAEPSLIVADGLLRRFHVEGDKPGTLNGWAVLHDDHGAAGTWRGGATCAWSTRSSTRMSRPERDAFRTKVREDKGKAQRQREVEQQHAAHRATRLWTLATPASPDHPYLLHKQVRPGNARQRGDLLVLLVQDIAGHARSLQFIAGDGTKKLLTGGAKRGNFILVAGSLPANLVLLAEGFATASTVATQFPSACVLAAIDAGNLEVVARAVRGRYPAAQIVVASDDDRATPGNPGLTKARAAAAAVGGKLVRPVWPEGTPDTATDFNDLYALMMGAPHV